MSARSRMTTRAMVERNTAGDGKWGTPGVEFTQVGPIDCRVFSKTIKDVDDSGKSAVVRVPFAHVPVAADVEQGDQLVNVCDRLGFVQFAGPLSVETKAPAPGPGSRPPYFELMLTGHL
ncbi:hypothetical protein LCGC14_1719800 [marine sediment metagenome]|uniref:Uncharacterized protein n=1 Tax=marine sediment metagenome TaxID=412755 RepID=A0A0F9KCN0_9ZZZZ